MEYTTDNWQRQISHIMKPVTKKQKERKETTAIWF